MVEIFCIRYKADWSWPLHATPVHPGLHSHLQSLVLVPHFPHWAAHSEINRHTSSLYALKYIVSSPQ